MKEDDLFKISKIEFLKTEKKKKKKLNVNYNKKQKNTHKENNKILKKD